MFGPLVSVLSGVQVYIKVFLIKNLMWNLSLPDLEIMFLEVICILKYLKIWK